jgi:hypothetical protein
MFIQRIGIHERRAAGATEEFGLEGLWQGEAGGADRNAGYICKRLLTNATIVGENKVKKVRRKGLEECQTRRWPQTVL